MIQIEARHTSMFPLLQRIKVMLSNSEDDTTKSRSSTSKPAKQSRQGKQGKRPKLAKRPKTTLLDLEATDEEIEKALKNLYGDDQTG